MRLASAHGGHAVHISPRLLRRAVAANLRRRRYKHLLTALTDKPRTVRCAPTFWLNAIDAVTRRTGRNQVRRHDGPFDSNERGV